MVPSFNDIRVNPCSSCNSPLFPSSCSILHSKHYVTNVGEDTGNETNLLFGLMTRQQPVFAISYDKCLDVMIKQ